MEKVFVKKTTSNKHEDVFLEVPRYFKAYASFNKVVDQNTIISLIGEDGLGMVIMDSITDTEYRKLTPIDESQFNEIYQKHLNIVQSYV